MNTQKVFFNGEWVPLHTLAINNNNFRVKNLRLKVLEFRIPPHPVYWLIPKREMGGGWRRNSSIIFTPVDLELKCYIHPS